jgi:hypothetical protein
MPKITIYTLGQKVVDFKISNGIRLALFTFLNGNNILGRLNNLQTLKKYWKNVKIEIFNTLLPSYTNFKRINYSN